MSWRSWTVAQLALPAAAHDAHHAVADREARRAGPQRRDLAGELEAGDVLRVAGRRRVEPALLHEVGAVEAGGAHAHQDLARAGLGIGVLLHADFAVADGRRAHRPESMDSSA